MSQLVASSTLPVQVVDAESLVLLIASLFLSIAISGLESGLLSVSRVRVRNFAKEGHPGAARLDCLLKRRRELLITLLVVGSAVNLVAFALVTGFFVAWYGPWGYALALGVSAPVYLIGIELLPKSIFKQFPFRSLTLLLPLLRLIDVLIRPLVEALGLLLRKRRPVESTKEGTSSERIDEFRALTETFERQGNLEPEERRLIHRVLDFSRVRVGDVMIPLSRVTGVPLGMPLHSVIALARESHFDQFPVLGPQGDLLGAVDVFEILHVSDAKADSQSPVGDQIRQLVRTHPEDSAIGTIRKLRRSGLHLAAVQDAEGRPLGIVTVADMVKRMVGQH